MFPTERRSPLVQMPYTDDLHRQPSNRGEGHCFWNNNGSRHEASHHVHTYPLLLITTKPGYRIDGVGLVFCCVHVSGSKLHRKRKKASGFFELMLPVKVFCRT